MEWIGKLLYDGLVLACLCYAAYMVYMTVMIIKSIHKDFKKEMKKWKGL